MKGADPSHHAHVFELLGGRLCLDFVNTVSGERPVAPVERLNDYRDLVSWGEQVGIVKPSRAKALHREARERPGDARRVLAQGIALREALFRIFTAISRTERVDKTDLATLNGHLRTALSKLRLDEEGNGFGLRFDDGDDALDGVLWHVARSASDVLTAADLTRVRMCEAVAIDGCSWLFYDETRNGQRRWCSMKDCGNREKARRFYAKRAKS